MLERPLHCDRLETGLLDRLAPATCKPYCCAVMRWYVPKPIRIPHWFQRYAVFDCVADPDRRGLSLYSVDYYEFHSKRRPIYVRHADDTSIAMPDEVLQKKRSGFPVRFHYAIELDRADAVRIPVGGIVRNLGVNIIPNPPRDVTVAMSTLFLNDYWVLALWLDHYRRLGVEWFFLYFNGPRHELESALSRLGEFDVSDCTFIEWRFSKFQQHKFVFENGRIRSAHNARHKRPNMHHGQRAELLHAARVFAENWKISWLGYFDLDEFLMLHGWNDLTDCLAANGDRDVLIFENRWAEDRGDPPPYGTRAKDRFVDVYDSDKCSGPDRRTKYFARPEAMIMPGIHRPYHSAKGASRFAVPPKKAHFLHFHDFNHERADWFGDRTEWVACEM